MSVIEPLQLFVYDLARDGGEFSARRILQQAGSGMGKKQIGNMTDPKCGRYLMLLSAPATIQDSHADDETVAMAAIRWIVDNNPLLPIHIWLRVEDGFAEQIRALYTPKVAETMLP